MLHPDRKAALATVLLALFAASGSNAMAKTQWEKTHPRRDQVNERLARQNKRIAQERKEGEITKDQAIALHQQDRQIRQEERAMASQHHGHLTKAEQRELNRQENVVSKEIGK
jgi:hypothetical protein